MRVYEPSEGHEREIPRIAMMNLPHQPTKIKAQENIVQCIDQERRTCNSK